jgi:hypothetical protein
MRSCGSSTAAPGRARPPPRSTPRCWRRWPARARARAQPRPPPPRARQALLSACTPASAGPRAAACPPCRLPGRTASQGRCGSTWPHVHHQSSSPAGARRLQGQHGGGGRERRAAGGAPAAAAGGVQRAVAGPRRRADAAAAGAPRLAPAACHLRRPAADALAPGPRGACVPSVPGSARVPGGRAQPENARRRGRRPW